MVQVSGRRLGGDHDHSEDGEGGGDLVPATIDLTNDPHDNTAHASTFAVDGASQPPENHGNGSHTSTFAVDGDAQPPETHGNGAHSSTFATESYVDNNSGATTVSSGTVTVSSASEVNIVSDHGSPLDCSLQAKDGASNGEIVYQVRNESGTSQHQLKERGESFDCQVTYDCYSI